MTRSSVAQFLKGGIVSLGLGGLALLSGCATIIEVGGFKVRQDAWEAAAAEVRHTAAFQLKCPADQLALTLLHVEYPSAPYPSRIGVDGCAQRIVYVRPVYEASYVLESSVGH